MKKLLSVLLAVLLILSLAACVKNKGEAVKEPSGEPAADRKEFTDEEKKTADEKTEAAPGTLVEMEPDQDTNKDEDAASKDADPENGKESEPESKDEVKKKADPVQGNEDNSVSNNDPREADEPKDNDDASEDVETGDDFTGLDVSEGDSIEIGEGQGVGGF